MESRVLLQPCQNGRMFVRRIVVHDRMQVELPRGLPLDSHQEPEPHPISMLRHAIRDDFPFRELEGPGTTWACRGVGHHASSSSCGRGTRADLFVCGPAPQSGSSRRTTERACARAGSEADPRCRQFSGELRGVGELGGFDAMRSEAVVPPEPLHQRRRAARGLGQRPRRPLRGGCRQLLRRAANDLGLEFRTRRRPATRPEGVLGDPLQPIVVAAISSRADGAPHATRRDGEVLVRGGQHDLRPRHQPCRSAPAPRPLLRLSPPDPVKTIPTATRILRSSGATCIKHRRSR
jgi:hypothetical protein